MVARPDMTTPTACPRRTSACTGTDARPSSLAWAERVHLAHVRLGVRLAGNCEACRTDDRPEWVRRAQANGLPTKDYTGAPR